MTSTPPKWRDVLKVHPAADVFDTISVTELRELGEDIQMRGMTSPVIFWKSGPRPEGVIDDIDVMLDLAGAELLDGRNRLDAMELVGMPVISDTGTLIAGSVKARLLFEGDGVNPFEYVVSANIYRRHLDVDTRKKLIQECILRNPERSNRAIAEMVNSTHPTVAANRKELISAGKLEPVTATVGADGRVRQVSTEKQVSRSAQVAREADKRQLAKAVAKVEKHGFRISSAAEEPKPAAMPGQARSERVVALSNHLNSDPPGFLSDLAALVSDSRARWAEISKYARSEAMQRIASGLGFDLHMVNELTDAEWLGTAPPSTKPVTPPSGEAPQSENLPIEQLPAMEEIEEPQPVTVKPELEPEIKPDRSHPCEWCGTLTDKKRFCSSRCSMAALRAERKAQAEASHEVANQL